MLNEIIVERVIEAKTVDTTVIYSDAVDVGGAQGVCFVVAFGTISAGTPVVKVQQGDTSSAESMTALVGSIKLTATTNDNKLAIIDVKKPTKRYVRVVVDRTAGASVIDAGIAIKYSGRVYPTIQGAKVANKLLLVSPEEVAST